MSMRATACANVAELVQVPKTGLGPCYFTFRQGQLAGPLVADGKSWPAPTESSGHSIKLPGNWSRNRGRIGLEIGAAGARQRKRKGPAAAAPGRRWWRSALFPGPRGPQKGGRDAWLPVGGDLVAARLVRSRERRVGLLRHQRGACAANAVPAPVALERLLAATAVVLHFRLEDRRRGGRVQRGAAVHAIDCHPIGEGIRAVEQGCAARRGLGAGRAFVADGKSRCTVTESRVARREMA